MGGGGQTWSSTQVWARPPLSIFVYATFRVRSRSIVDVSRNCYKKLSEFVQQAGRAIVGSVCLCILHFLQHFGIGPQVDPRTNLRTFVSIDFPGAYMAEDLRSFCNRRVKDVINANRFSVAGLTFAFGTEAFKEVPGRDPGIPGGT